MPRLAFYGSLMSRLTPAQRPSDAPDPVQLGRALVGYDSYDHKTIVSHVVDTLANGLIRG